MRLYMHMLRYECACVLCTCAKDFPNVPPTSDNAISCDDSTTNIQMTEGTKFMSSGDLLLARRAGDGSNHDFNTTR